MGLHKFPIGLDQPIEHAGPLPKAADVVVIGGGVIGICSALFLTRKGLSVVVLEKGRVAGEQSSRNWGWIRQQGRDPDELPIMVEAAQHWRDLAAQTVEDIGLTQGGVTYMAKTEKQAEAYAAWLPYAQANGVDSRMLSRAELSELMPEAAAGWPAALYTPSDMRAEPWVAVPALARLAAREGVAIVEGCAARGVETSGGTISAVVTEAGVVQTREVIVAGGAWSSLLLRSLGVSIPQLSVKSSVVAVDAAPMVYQGGGVGSGVAFRPRQDGGYSLAMGGFHELFIGPDAVRALPKYVTQLLADPFGTRFWPLAPKGYPDAWGTKRRWALDAESPFERMRVLDPTPHVGKLRRLVRDFEALFPAVGPVKAKAMWAGMIDTMPDIVPVIDKVADMPGLTIATGMAGHGFGIGPGVGRVVSDLVTGGEIGHDLTRFRLSRFSDGSSVDLGPAL